MTSLPTTVSFESALLRRLPGGLFRRMADGAAAYVLSIDGTEYALPFNGLRREFGIAPGTRDDETLHLIEEALDYVTVLLPDEPLPGEVLDGTASWEPAPSHRQAATARIHAGLVAWMLNRPPTDPPQDPRELVRQMEDPANKCHVRQALEKAAESLGYDGPDRGEALSRLVADLTEDLASIEYLREHFLGGVRIVSDRMPKAQACFRADRELMRQLIHIGHLFSKGAREIEDAFLEIDAQTAEPLQMLKNLRNQQPWLRDRRNRLYKRYRAWKPILAGWTALHPRADDHTLRLLHETHRFLAPRYAPVNEWILMGRQPPPRRKTVGGIRWL
jgi:hypothetical protein